MSYGSRQRDNPSGQYNYFKRIPQGQSV